MVERKWYTLLSNPDHRRHVEYLLLRKPDVEAKEIDIFTTTAYRKIFRKGLASVTTRLSFDLRQDVSLLQAAQ